MLYIKINAALGVVATSEGLPQECSVWTAGLGPCPYAFSFAPEDTEYKNPILGEGWLSVRDIYYHASPKLFSQQLADSLTASQRLSRRSSQKTKMATRQSSIVVVKLGHG